MIGFCRSLYDVLDYLILSQYKNSWYSKYIYILEMTYKNAE